MSEWILEAKGLHKDFRGFQALKGVDLQVSPGTVHVLIGPNGAGKTTLFNILTKFIAPTAGQVFFKGRDVTRDEPAKLAREGMVRSFQISSTFGSLSVLENVRGALQRRLNRNSYAFWKSEAELSNLDEAALAYINQVGLGQQAGVRARELSYGAKRALELATTLALEPTLLLLDEPTAGIAREEVGRITALIRSVAAGRTVLMVEHNLRVVSEISDRITVLSRGSVLAEGDYATVAKDPRVVEAYLGGEDDDGE